MEFKIFGTMYEVNAGHSHSELIYLTGRSKTIYNPSKYTP